MQSTKNLFIISLIFAVLIMPVYANAQPDLAITKVEIFDQKVVNNGNQVSFRVTIQNIGDGVVHCSNLNSAFGDGNSEVKAFPSSYLPLLPGEVRVETLNHVYFKPGTYTALFEINRRTSHYPSDTVNCNADRQWEDTFAENNQKSVEVVVQDLSEDRVIETAKSAANDLRKHFEDGLSDINRILYDFKYEIGISKTGSNTALLKAVAHITNGNIDYPHIQDKLKLIVERWEGNHYSSFGREVYVLIHGPASINPCNYNDWYGYVWCYDVEASITPVVIPPSIPPVVIPPLLPTINDIAEFDIASVNNDWKTITLKKTFKNPVVIANPISLNDNQPAHIRIRNIKENSFEMKVEEWAYLDGKHANEDVGYIVMEAGTYAIDGKKIEAGKTTANNKFSSVSFTQEFSTAPVVFSQAQTVNGKQPIVTRNRNINENGFEVRVQEEEAKGKHVKETIGFIALEPGVYDEPFIFGDEFEVGKTNNIVTDKGSIIEFTGYYFVEPMFLADMQTFNGRNTAGLRYKDKITNTIGPGTGSVYVMAEEEASKDKETTHVGESVGYILLAKPPVLIDLRHDLEVVDLSIEPENPKVNEMVTFTGIIKNLGPNNIKNYIVYLKTGDKICFPPINLPNLQIREFCFDNILKFAIDSELKAGESTTKTIEYTYESAGSYNAELSLSSFSDINPNNNKKTIAVTVG